MTYPDLCVCASAQKGAGFIDTLPTQWQAARLAIRDSDVRQSFLKEIQPSDLFSDPWQKQTFSLGKVPLELHPQQAKKQAQSASQRSMNLTNRK
ncbi:hypothetical protein P2G88_01870 [Aliiglaciecola sp. CAU 1673]|uniref:hypothetical protein n=1 Tax=Aliiglaciecola sp. CAU 1673 TaxID=3032595 RepID=UPI0023DA839A|nr:hypothetical protein [Aliiglaciecola sp. CAU 1673]MDF2177000.1 hypothetical protein [Aliiglaciecola sp. CAU 1673]